MKNKTIRLNFNKNIEIEEDYKKAYIKYANLFFSITDGTILLWPDKYDKAEELENNNELIVVTKDGFKKLFNARTKTFITIPIKKIEKIWVDKKKKSLIFLKNKKKAVILIKINDKYRFLSEIDCKSINVNETLKNVLIVVKKNGSKEAYVVTKQGSIVHVQTKLEQPIIIILVKDNKQLLFYTKKGKTVQRDISHLL